LVVLDRETCVYGIMNVSASIISYSVAFVDE